MSEAEDRKTAAPRASRPNMPGYGLASPTEGDGLLPWSWAVERLTRARNYFLATVTPTESEARAVRPHLMVIWGIWQDDTFQFSTGRESRKGKNLAANPTCVVSVEGGEEAVIVEGEAICITEPATLERFAKAYEKKYAWDMSKHTEPVYVVRPQGVFGQIEKTFTNSATRWTFGA